MLILVLLYFTNYIPGFIYHLSYLKFCTRQTDILLTEKKSHYRFICYRNERDISTCIYEIVNLLKSYDNIHGMTYTIKSC